MASPLADQRQLLAAAKGGKGIDSSDDVTRFTSLGFSCGARAAYVSGSRGRAAAIAPFDRMPPLRSDGRISKGCAHDGGRQRAWVRGWLPAAVLRFFFFLLLLVHGTRMQLLQKLAWQRYLGREMECVACVPDP